MTLTHPSIPVDDEEDNPIMAEVRRNKDAAMAKYGYDLHRAFEAMRRTQFLYGNDVVERCKKTGEFVVIFKGSGTMNPHVDEDAPIQSNDRAV